MTDRPVSDLRGFYSGRRVLLTGHTGFKGSWLALWLSRLGAEVHAIALPPDQGEHSLFERAQVGSRVHSRFVDIRDFAGVREAFEEARPEAVFHLAARALVQQGYRDPLDTFATNVMGTANVLEAARGCDTVRSVVCVTTDKVYLNKEWEWPYRESDELGGLDPYSASKAAAELVARTYQNALRRKDRPFAIATARGGNVIGGGDWSPFRLVPDIVRAITAGQPLTLRYPRATRPWQHVLDLCHGYLLLAEQLTLGTLPLPLSQGAWNFGPVLGSERTVADLVTSFLAAWGEPSFPVELAAAEHFEAMMLRLDPSRANQRLGWHPALDVTESIAWTARWYRDYAGKTADAASLTFEQITRFEALLTSARQP